MTSEYRFANVVWGEEFTDAFLRVCLPSLLTPGNLPDVAARARSSYRIYTTERFAAKIRASTAGAQLARVMPVEYAIIEGLTARNKYRVMNRCHAHFLAGPHPDGCGLLVNCPDVVWADGALARVREIAERGKRVVMASTPRLTRETFAPAYAAAAAAGPISPRQLLSLASGHWHPVTRSLCWDEHDGDNGGPGEYIWRIPGEGFILRTFQFQPIFIRPAVVGIAPEIAVDADYPSRVCPDKRDMYFVEDSDELCILDFTSAADVGTLMVPGVRTMAGTVAWAKANTNDQHREFVGHVLRFHDREMTPGAWGEAKRRSDDVIGEILERLATEALDDPAERLSPFRYASPRFLAGKLVEKGPRAFLSTGIERALRPLVSADVTIRLHR